MMMAEQKQITITFLLSIACVGLVVRASDLEWLTYRLKFEKSYSNPIEDSRRRAIFENNHNKIKLHNANKSNSYRLGYNKYTDWTEYELKSRLFNRPQQVIHKLSEYEEKLSQNHIESILSQGPKEIPDELNWSEEEGFVTDVKDQLDCGSCWSFATTGVLEGQQKRQLNLTNLTSLSEQNLIDCSEENRGCGGGLTFLALQFIARQGGVSDSEHYPYEAKNDTCRFDKITLNNVVNMKLSGYSTLEPKGDEEMLKRMVASFGPISVAFAGGNDKFIYYDWGVLDNPDCNKEILDHEALLVGYGKDRNGSEYWLVKNSFGIRWGEKGYIKMARNKDNQCGIASEAVIPRFKSI